MSDKRKVWTQEMEDFLKTEFPKSEGLDFDGNRKLKEEIINKINQLRSEANLSAIKWPAICNKAKKIGLRWFHHNNFRGKKEKLDKNTPAITTARDSENETTAEKKLITQQESEKISVWDKDKDALRLLTRFVRGGFDLEPLYKRLSSLIPKKEIDKKVKELRGMRPEGVKNSSTLFEAGIGRIANDAEVESVQTEGVLELQDYTLESPFKIDVKNSGDFRIAVINGPHLGLEYNRVLDENVLRNYFRYAQQIGVDAIFITSGLIWTDMKKSAGRLTTHRGLYHGLDFDPGTLDPDYREEAKEIRKKRPPNRIGFTTLRERVMNALGGWRNKVTVHKDGSPIFTGPIFFSFGYPEEEMIEESAHGHLRYLKTCMELEARLKRQSVEAQLVYALKQSGGRETRLVKSLRKKVEKLLRLEKRKSANTNIDKLEHKRFVKIIRTLFVSWYKEAIPNSEFIGQGNLILEIGGKKTEIRQSNHERPADEISDIIKSVGQRDLNGTLPDIILGAGAFNLSARWSARECMRDVEKDQVQIWQLPVLVDRDYILGSKFEMIKKGSPIERLVNNNKFEPGAFILGMTDGLWDCHPLPISMFTRRTSKRKQPDYPKEIIIYVEGDQHTGNPSKDYVWDERDQRWLPMEVAASEIFIREFTEKGELIPFHIFSSLGDSTQARHFATEQNRHPEHESYGVLESETSRLLRKIRDNKIEPDKFNKSVSELMMRLNYQLRLRGEHWYQQQMEDFIDYSLERRIKFFFEILKRGKSANIKVSGIQQILTGNSNIQDRRDIGLENFLDGNHGKKTTEGTMTEAWFFARILSLYIFAQKDCLFELNELKSLVRAPIFGNIAAGYGLVSAGDGYRWGLHLRHDPTRKSGQDGDPLQRATKNLAERGDYGLIFNKHFFISANADQHRYAGVWAPNKVVVNCACGTHGDSYGEDWGFSRSNLGGLIICLPVDGPSAGPVRVVPISHVFIRKYMANPREINWVRLLPNPA